MAGPRPQGDRTREQLLAEDRRCLRGIAGPPFEACQRISTTIDKRSLVTADTNSYSAPVRWAHHPVEVKLFVDQVELWCETQRVEVHERRYEKGRFILEPTHYLTRPGRTIPFELLGFQYRDIMGPLLGWKRADGSRRYRFGFVTVAKGNTKSALAAAALLYLVFGDGEPVSLGYAASTSAKAARNVFDFCARMVRNSPQLSKALKIIDHTGRIIDPKRRNVLAIIPNRPDAAEGKSIHACVYDEVHLAKDRKLFEAIQYGGRSRAQSLILVITTAASDRHGIAYELYEDAQRLLAGAVIDHARFAFVAESSHDDDPMDPAVWARANPALGITVNRADFEAEAQRAADSPAKMVNFKRRRLNVWGMTDVATFIDLDRWIACRADVDADTLAGRECYAGLDLSSNCDLTACVLVFPSADESIDVLAYHWLPEDVLPERAKTDWDMYPAMVQAGHLETTPGDYIDQAHIRRRIGELGQRFAIREIAYDPTFAADLGPTLADDGYAVFEFWQTHRMYSPVMAKLDAITRAKKLRHNNPLLDWQVSNLLAHTNENGHMKPAKPAPGKKIDGVSALLMALGKIVKADRANEKQITYTTSPLILVG